MKAKKNASNQEQSTGQLKLNFDSSNKNNQNTGSAKVINFQKVSDLKKANIVSKTITSVPSF
jgi:hypothetical protein